MTIRSALLFAVAAFAAGVWVNAQNLADATASEAESSAKEQKLSAPPAGGDSAEPASPRPKTKPQPTRHTSWPPPRDLIA
jgi:hypothetical protein